MRRIIIAPTLLSIIISQSAFAAQLPLPRHKHFRPYHGRIHRSHIHSPGPCAVCVHSEDQAALISMTQNVGRAVPDYCEKPWWWRYVAFSAGVNLDFGKFGNRNVGNQLPFATGAGYTGENTNHFSLNDFYLNVDVHINDYVNAFYSLSYINASNWYSVAYQTQPDSLVFGDNNNRLTMQQAFIHIGNFNESPVFLEFGQQFQDFGRYSIHPITQSMTQSLSETLRTSAKIGFISPWGCYGSATAFQTPVPTSPGGHLSFNYIGTLGFSHRECDYIFDIGASWMYDIQGVNLVGNSVAYRQGVTPDLAFYHKRANVATFYTDLTYYPIGIQLRYVKALHELDPLDLPIDLTNLTEGAKPWAASIQGHYSWQWLQFPQNLYVGYQVSRDTVFLNLPRNRTVAGYGVQLYKNATLTAEWDHDVAYPVAEGGPEKGNSNLVTLRLAATFN